MRKGRSFFFCFCFDRELPFELCLPLFLRMSVGTVVRETHRMHLKMHDILHREFKWKRNQNPTTRNVSGPCDRRSSKFYHHDNFSLIVEIHLPTKNFQLLSKLLSYRYFQVNATQILIVVSSRFINIRRVSLLFKS